MNEKTTGELPIRVAKRDGSIEPFVMAKMLNCIHNGLVVCGEPHALDCTTAGSLAEAIYDYLRASYPADPVPSSHLSDLVELVLNQTGHAEAGLAIRQHAGFREQRRRKLMVATSRTADGRFVQHRWNKSLLVQHLRRRHHLDSPAARMIAGRAEQLLLDCGLRVVTAGLVREMTRSELLAWGLLPGALAVKRARRFREERRVKDQKHEK